MKQLFLADLEGMSEKEIKAHISRSYEFYDDLSNYSILLAYESVGSWGCDSSSYFLLEDLVGNLFETYGSHCSCHGFEGQFELEETTVEYLQSDNFEFFTGGYDYDSASNSKQVKAFMLRLDK